MTDDLNQMPTPVGDTPGVQPVEFPEELRIEAAILAGNTPHEQRLKRILTQAADEIDRARRMAAVCYVALGATHDLPEPWLDALLAASNGDPFDSDPLLPYVPAFNKSLDEALEKAVDRIIEARKA